MAFSASEAAFEGFRIIRREPKNVAAWAVVLLVFDVVAMLGMLPFLRSAAAFQSSGAATMTPAQGLAMLGQVGQVYLVMIPISLIMTSVLAAAVYRAVLRPQDQGFGRLKLGGDELRLFGLLLLEYVLIFAALLVVGIVIGALAGVLAAATPAAMGVRAGLLVLLCVVVFCAAIWVWVRLSFAAPLTFSQGRIRLFSSWKLTRGRFWPLFGCYLLAIVFVFLIALVDLAVSGVVAIGMNRGALAQAATAMMRPDYSSYASMFTPFYVVRLLIGAAFGVVMWTVVIAAQAAAFHEITGPTLEDQAQTFA